MTGRWDFISGHRAGFGVQRICRVLGFSRSGYYRWLAGAEARSERRAADGALVVEIREIHTGHKGTYGVRRVHAELRGFGHTVNRKRVERLMRINGIEGRHLRRRKRTTVPDRLAPPAPDLVQRDFSARQLDEKWCGDITYVQVGGSWLYLARVLAQVCDGYGIRRSMGRVGSSYDNALAESFWQGLKRETMHQRLFSTVRQARLEIFQWLTYCNARRRHSALNYLSPAEFEQQHLRADTLAIAA